MRKGSLFAVLAAAAAFFLVTQVASAQYPPPKTSLVCAVNQIDVRTGGSTAVAATLRDLSGTPISGETVHFKVVAGNASLSSSSAVTDGSGTAVVTVNIGNTSGPLSIEATSESSECQAYSEVAGSTFVPPNTGSAGLLDGSESDAATFAGLALGASIMAAGLVAVRRARVS